MIFFIFQFVFVAPDVTSSRTVHEEMSRHLPTLLRPANTDFLVINKFMHHSSFFFEIMVKSMAQHLLGTGRIKVSARCPLNNKTRCDSPLCPLLPVIWMTCAWFNFHGSVHHVSIFVNKTSMMQFVRYLLYPSQHYMFRMSIPSILRSTGMYGREGTIYVCM